MEMFARRSLAMAPIAARFICTLHTLECGKSSFSSSKTTSVSQFDSMKIDTNSQLPDFSAGTDDPSVMERARRFSSVVYLAARIYAGYKSAQVWNWYRFSWNQIAKPKRF